MYNMDYYGHEFMNYMSAFVHANRHDLNNKWFCSHKQRQHNATKILLNLNELRGFSAIVWCVDHTTICMLILIKPIKAHTHSFTQSVRLICTFRSTRYGYRSAKCLSHKFLFLFKYNIILYTL